MSQDLNSVTLSGRLTRDPELKAINDDLNVVEFGLAVNRSRKVNEEWIEEVSFFDVSSFKRAENINNKLRKGDSVVVLGELRQRTWETDEGSKREKVSVIASNITGEGFYRKAGEEPERAESEASVAEIAEANKAVQGAVTASGDDIPF